MSMQVQSRDRAIEALRAGDAVVFPTDTVFGVGVAVRYAPSPQAIYDVKQRDAGKPIAWLVGGPDALDEFGRDVPAVARELAARHWPGALTIIVKASDSVPSAFRSQQGTIGMRMPASEVARELIDAVGPLATSSANISGEVDPCVADDLDERLVNAVAEVVRGTVTSSGVASTVVDCSQGGLLVVRQGTVDVRA